MYFSLISPAPGSERQAAHDWISGSYEQHQWLWRFLPAPAGSPREFLFRRHDENGLPRFYVVSRVTPVAPTAHWDVASKPYAPALQPGEWCRFELRANPVVTSKDANGRAARHDVVMQAKRRLLQGRGLARWADWATPDRPALASLVQECGTQWLQARADRLGVEFDAEGLRAEGYEQHRGKAGMLRLSTIDYIGRLRVRDPEALHRALVAGIGHGKAFGCGLMLVRRETTG